jgi:hypothetical protein
VPELTLTAVRAEAVAQAVAPHLAVVLRLECSPSAHVRGVTLSCQIHIEPRRRRYAREEEERLTDLFGERSRWEETLRPLLWTTMVAAVPAFEGRTETTLLIPCTLDLHLAAAKYFQALDAGAVPLVLYFRGTVFHGDPGEALRASPVPWTSESRLELPVEVYRAAVDRHYPNGTPLPVGRDVAARLGRYKLSHGLSTWDQAIESLLQAHEERLS